MNRAYVTYVMLNDDYVPGALALGKSILETGTDADLMCMVTKGVSQESVTLLSMYYHVKVVPLIYFNCPAMLTPRQRQLYGNWISYSFTKWNVLTLDQYDKVIYLDADHIVTENIDHLFELENLPAMCFRSQFNDVYKKYKHGDFIDNYNLKKIFNKCKILGDSGTVVLEPDFTLYNTIISKLSIDNEILMKTRYHNGFDEQVFLQSLIHLGRGITQLSHLYVWNAGCYNELNKRDKFKVINYYGDKKPWHVSLYPDTKIWHYYYLLVLQDKVKFELE